MGNTLQRIIRDAVLEALSARDEGVGSLDDVELLKETWATKYGGPRGDGKFYVIRNPPLPCEVGSYEDSRYGTRLRVVEVSGAKSASMMNGTAQVELECGDFVVYLGVSEIRTLKEREDWMDIQHARVIYE